MNAIPLAHPLLKSPKPVHPNISESTKLLFASECRYYITLAKSDHSHSQRSTESVGPATEAATRAARSHG